MADRRWTAFWYLPLTVCLVTLVTEIASKLNTHARLWITPRDLLTTLLTTLVSSGVTLAVVMLIIPMIGFIERVTGKEPSRIFFICLGAAFHAVVLAYCVTTLFLA